jgi:uridine kinase
VQLDALAATVLAGPVRLRGARLVCIDGRAGAGKTSLANELVAVLAGSSATAANHSSTNSATVTLIHMDDVYEGWAGLATAADVVASQLISPWGAGEPAALAAWDWRAYRRLDAVPVELSAIVVLEGVGSWSRRYADVVSTLVWLECDEETRRRRALERDGSAFAAHWDSWAADEARVHARERTRAYADVVIDTSPQRAGSLP